MLSRLVFAAALAVAITANPLEDRASNVCSSGIYGELSPLKNYPIAVAFCQAVFPPQCVNAKHQIRRNGPAVTTTTTTTAKTTTKKSTITTAPPTTTTAKVSTSSMDSNASLWSKCTKQPQSVVSTLCSCIQSHTPCTTSTTSAKTTSKTTSKTSSKTTPSTTPSTTPVVTTPVITTPVITTPSTTTSSAAAGPTCTPGVQCFSDTGTDFDVHCGQLYVAPGTERSTAPATDFTNCADQCGNDFSCFGFTFSSITGTCVTFGSQTGTFETNPEFDSGLFNGLC